MEKRMFNNTKDTKHYEVYPTTRGNFKKFCINNGFNFEDYTEVLHSRTDRSTGQYLYFKKEDVVKAKDGVKSFTNYYDELKNDLEDAMAGNGMVVLKKGDDFTIVEDGVFIRITGRDVKCKTKYIGAKIFQRDVGAELYHMCITGSHYHIAQYNEMLLVFKPTKNKAYADLKSINKKFEEFAMSLDIIKELDGVLTDYEQLEAEIEEEIRIATIELETKREALQTVREASRNVTDELNTVVSVSTFYKG